MSKLSIVSGRPTRPVPAVSPTDSPTASTTPDDAADAAERPAVRLSQRVVVPVICMAVTFISIVDGAITTVALPSIARQFHLTTAALDGVVVVYPVCLAMTIPSSAWLTDRFGGRRTVLWSLSAFVAASMLCGSAADLTQLIGYRALQGCAAGVLMPAATAMMYRTFKPHEQVRVTRFMIIPQQIAPTLAPMIGGLLADDLSWRWVFYVNLPFGVPTVVFGALFLAEHRDHPAGRFDLPGLLLCAGALGALMLGVCEGPEHGWSSPEVLAALVVGALLLAAAIVFELRTAEPILRLRLFTDRLFRSTNVVAMVGLVPIMGAMYVGPLFLQQGQGRSAITSGTTTFTEALGVLLTVQIVGVLYARVGPRLIIAVGMTGVAVVLVLFSTCDAGTGLWTFRLYMFLLGFCMGSLFMPTAVASITTIARPDTAQASTLNTVVRQTGGALAPAVVTTVLVLSSPGGRHRAHPPLAAYQHAYLVLAALAVATALLALTIDDHATRTPRAPEPATPTPRRLRPTPR